MQIRRELAVEVIDKFCELLDRHGIIIPDSDREGNEGESSIYGCTYYDLEDEIVALLDYYKVKYKRGKKPKFRGKCVYCGEYMIIRDSGYECASCGLWIDKENAREQAKRHKKLAKKQKKQARRIK